MTGGKSFYSICGEGFWRPDAQPGWAFIILMRKGGGASLGGMGRRWPFDRRGEGIRGGKRIV